jgi:hypothetical protein
VVAKVAGLSRSGAPPAGASDRRGDAENVSGRLHAPSCSIATRGVHKFGHVAGSPDLQGASCLCTRRVPDQEEIHPDLRRGVKAAAGSIVSCKQTA